MFLHSLAPSAWRPGLLLQDAAPCSHSVSPVVPLPHAVPARVHLHCLGPPVGRGFTGRRDPVSICLVSQIKRLYLVNAWMLVVCPSLGVRRPHGSIQPIRCPAWCRCCRGCRCLESHVATAASCVGHLPDGVGSMPPETTFLAHPESATWTPVTSATPFPAAPRQGVKNCRQQPPECTQAQLGQRGGCSGASARG